MERYNYLEAVKADILFYILENYTSEEITEKLEDRTAWEEELNDDLWVCDSVTGNASGSYTFNRWKAEECICHNFDLLGEALWEFGGAGVDILAKGAEYCDVTIRCYILGEALAEVLDHLENE